VCVYEGCAKIDRRLIMSVRLFAWNNSVNIGRIFVAFLWGFCKNLSWKFSGDKNRKKVADI